MNTSAKTLTLLSILLATFSSAKAEDFLMLNGRAVEVWDGDSFNVQLSESSRRFLEPYLTPPEYRSGIISIQLAGIDCPERSQNHPFWQHSRSQLIRYLNNQYLNIQVEVSRNGQINRSANGFFAVVRAGRNPIAINQAMVASGWAKDDYRFSFGYPYIMAQWEAMNRRRGIWSNYDQYHAENEFRMRLYGTAERRPEIHTYPEYRESGKRGNEQPRQFSQGSNKEYAQNPRWKNEVPGQTRRNVPQFKNP